MHKIKKKTKKAASKRFLIKKYKIMHKKAYRKHLLRKKRSNRLRRLSLHAQIHASDLHLCKILL